MEREYLSIVAASRNDNHGGNLNERMQNFIDNLNRQSEKFNFPIEIIIVDWNPPNNKPLLHEVLKGKFRSIIVPGGVHKRYGQHKLIPLYQMIAKNVGIRRARGEFILATNVDILFDDSVISFLSKKKLQKGCIYRAYRYDAKSGVKNVEEAKKNLIRINLSYTDELCTNACGDFQLLHRNDWFRLRGYYEKDVFSIHIDSIFEYYAVYNGCKEIVLRPPKVVYHIEHAGGWVPGIEFSKEYNRMNDDKIKKISYEDLLNIIRLMEAQNSFFYYNKDNWGLKDEKFEEIDIVR